MKCQTSTYGTLYNYRLFIIKSNEDRLIDRSLLHYRINDYNHFILASEVDTTLERRWYDYEYINHFNGRHVICVTTFWWHNPLATVAYHNTKIICPWHLLVNISNEGASLQYFRVILKRPCNQSQSTIYKVL